MQALHRTAGQHGYAARILNAVEEVNQDQKSVLLNKIDKQIGADIKGKTFAIWGLAFKPNTDDMREAPSRVIIDGLISRGAKVKAYDPVANEEAQRIYKDNSNVEMLDDLYAATDSVDALIIVTEWKAFRSPDFVKLKQQMNEAIIFDGRNIYDPNQLKDLGFRYHAIGRSN